MGEKIELWPGTTVDLDMWDRRDEFEPSDSIGDAKNFLKGVVTGPLTVAPDILGMTRGLSTNPMSMLPGQQTNSLVPEGFSGNPIREAVGMDPESGWGMAGEFVDPTNAMAKAPAAVAKVAAKYGPDIIAAGVRDIPNAILAAPVFHGSPHRFDIPSNAHMGTGEGAQAYGWGHYVAEGEGTGKFYRDALSGTLVIDGAEASPKLQNFVADFLDDSGGITKESLDDLLRQAKLEQGREVFYHSGGTVTRAKNFDLEARPGWYSIREDARGLTGPYQDEWLAGSFRSVDPEDIAALERLTPENIRVDGGHLYEYDIPDEQIDKMLDWDAPLSEQPKSVQDAILEMMSEEGSFNGTAPDEMLAAMREATDGDVLKQNGEELYRSMSDYLTDEHASGWLEELGIPGIRYLDATSRHTTNWEIAGALVDGKHQVKNHAMAPSLWKSFDTRAEAEAFLATKANKGTRNMVLFDPENTVKSVKRDGEVVNALTQDQQFAEKTLAHDPRAGGRAMMGENALTPQTAEKTTDPWIGVLTKDGKFEGRTIQEGMEADWHHTNALRETIDDFDRDDSLRFVRDFVVGEPQNTMTLRGQAILDPYGKGERQIKQLARQLRDSGVPGSIEFRADNLFMGTKFEGKSLGSIDSWADYTKGR